MSDDYSPYGEREFADAIVMEEDGVSQEQITILTKLEPAIVTDTEGQFCTMGLRVTLKSGDVMQFVIPPAWVLVLHEALDTITELMADNDVDPVWDPVNDLPALVSALSHRMERDPDVKAAFKEDLDTQPEWLQEMVRQQFGDI